MRRAGKKTRSVEVLGILNTSPDSFSDGGRFAGTPDAIAHGMRLLADADILDVGAASSHPDALEVDPELEIARLGPVIDAFKTQNARLSVDSFKPRVQIFAARRGVEFLNDIHGFPDASIYPELLQTGVKLIAMHAVQAQGIAVRQNVNPALILDRIYSFFDRRVEQLLRVFPKDRIILDPGMGFFLSTDPEASLRALRALPALKARYGLPVLVSVSRKSFLGALTGREVDGRAAATLAAELFAADSGADYIRTHDARALKDAWRITQLLKEEKP
jgi:dihydropteroate synthase type 2